MCRFRVRVIAFSLPLLALLPPSSARATPFDYLSVGDPLQSELRTLDALGLGPLAERFHLPHLNTGPYQLCELQGTGAPPTDLDLLHRISAIRLERALGRDAAEGFAPHPEYRSTPRLYQRDVEGERFEISAGIAGRGTIDRHETRFTNGSGLESRIAIGLDHWLAYSRFSVGRFDSAHTFADPIVPGNDLILLTEETYIAYTGERQRWAMQFGQNRWSWGPGEEGSLVLSRTMPSVTGLAMRAHLESMKLDLISLSATLEQAAGEQLAAHRIEWQPHDNLRLGVSEAARYKWPGWQPLYVLGAIPYVIVQRLHLQNETDSLAAHRNNILTSFDASWRIASGTRVYGEILIDDLHARSGKNANKYAFQVGYDGVGALGDTRLTWGGEYTRVTRFVYTSFYGRGYTVGNTSLGFPVAPDSRRLRVRAAWDLGPDWQLTARVTHSDKGENTLDQPFVPGSPRVNSAQFQGILETTRMLELGVRWWPASGVDLQLSGGYLWVDQADHVVGATRRSAEAALEVRVLR